MEAYSISPASFQTFLRKRVRIKGLRLKSILDDEGVVLKTKMIGTSKKSTSMNDLGTKDCLLRTYEINILDSTVYKIPK